MNLSRVRFKAFTIVELIVVVAALGLLTALLVRGQADTMARANRIDCVNNLKQLGLALRMWSNDHNGRFPMQLNSDKGGSHEGIDKEQVWLHFTALSNQLSNPKVLVCRADDRQSATTLSDL